MHVNVYIYPALLLSGPLSTSHMQFFVRLVPSPTPFSVLQFALSTSMYYCQRKPKNKELGRPGNEASSLCHRLYVNALL